MSIRSTFLRCWLRHKYFGERRKKKHKVGTYVARFTFLRSSVWLWRLLSHSCTHASGFPWLSINLALPNQTHKRIIGSTLAHFYPSFTRYIWYGGEFFIHPTNDFDDDWTVFFFAPLKGIEEYLVWWSATGRPESINHIHLTAFHNVELLPGRVVIVSKWLPRVWGIVRGFGSSAEYFIGVVSFSAHCSLPLSNPSYLTTALVLAPRWSSLTHSVSLVWFLIKREHCFGINIFRCSQGPDTVHYKWATINYSSQSDTVPGVPGVVIPRGSTRSSRRTWRCVKFLLEASTRNLRTQFPVLAGDARFFQGFFSL